MASAKRKWNNLGNSAIEDTLQYALMAKEEPGKNKYKCIHYDLKTGLCEKINIGCVGPSNHLCPDYCTDDAEVREHYEKVRSQEQTKPAVGVKSAPVPDNMPTIKVGTVVWSKAFGRGTVISISKDHKYCKVKFVEGIKKFTMQVAFLNGFLVKK